jgi:hypothetical protein
MTQSVVFGQIGARMTGPALGEGTKYGFPDELLYFWSR